MDAEKNPRNRPGRCRLTHTINDPHYAVRPIASQADDVSRAFRLCLEEDLYDLAPNIHGPICDCPASARRLRMPLSP